MELDHTFLPTHTPALSLFLKGPNAPSVVEVGISAPLRCPQGMVVSQPIDGQLWQPWLCPRHRGSTFTMQIPDGLLESLPGSDRPGSLHP